MPGGGGTGLWLSGGSPEQVKQIAPLRSCAVEAALIAASRRAALSQEELVLPSDPLLARRGGWRGPWGGGEEEGEERESALGFAARGVPSFWHVLSSLSLL